jgi:hypothetical protein
MSCHVPHDLQTIKEDAATDPGYIFCTLALCMVCGCTDPTPAGTPQPPRSIHQSTTHGTNRVPHWQCLQTGLTLDTTQQHQTPSGKSAQHGHTNCTTTPYGNRVLGTAPIGHLKGCQLLSPGLSAPFKMEDWPCNLWRVQDPRL